MKLKNLVASILAIAILASCASQPDYPENETWHFAGEMLTPRAEGRAVALDGLIYIVGGHSSEPVSAMHIYDPETGQWKVGAEMPENRHHFQMVAFDGLIYVLGGAIGDPTDSLFYEPHDNVWVYNPVADTWTVKDPMPEPRTAGDAVVVGEYIYVVGGAGPSRAVLRYNPADDSWTRLAELNVAREHVHAAVINDQIYLTGGRWGTLVTMSSVEIYDIANDTWAIGVPMNEPRSATATWAIEGKIYVSGGEVLDVDPVITLSSVTVFDPSSGEWSYVEETPVPLHGHQVAVVDSQVFIFGGSTLAGRLIDNQAIYIMDTGD